MATKAFELSGEITVKSDGVVENLKKVDENLKKTQKGMQDVESTSTHFGSKIGNVFKTIGGLASSTAIVGFFKGCVSGAEKAATSNAKMTEVLHAASKATDEQINSLKSYASQLQNTGVISAGLNKTAMTQLSTFGLTTDSIKKLIPELDNMAVNQKGVNATSEDMMGYANLIGKAMQGNATAMSRVGVTLTDTQKKQIENGNEMQRAATIAEVLKQNYGNLNEEIAKTPEGKAKQLSNNWNTLKTQIGTQLLPILQALTGALQKVFDWWNSLGDGTKKAILIFGTVVGVMALVASAITTVTGVLGGLGLVVNLAFAPWVVLIAGVVAAIVILWNKCEWFRNLITGAWEGLKAIFSGLIDGIVSAWNSAWDGICSFFKGVAEVLKSVWDGVCTFFKYAFDIFVIAFKIALTPLKLAFDFVVGSLKAGWELLCKILAPPIKAAIDVIKKDWEMFKTAFGYICDALKAVWDFLVSIFEPPIKAAIDVIKKDWELFKVAFQFICDIISSVWKGICDTISSVWNGICSTISSVWEGVSSAFGSVCDGISSVWEGLCDVIGSIWDGVCDGVSSAWDGITAPFKAVVDAIGNIWDGIRSLIKLPHFSISGEFSLDPPSIPSVGIDWYSTGGIFTKPTIFGGVGVGDADNGKGNQAEAVMRYKDLMSIVKMALNKPIEVVLNVDGREFTRTVVAPNQDQLEAYGEGRY